MFRQQTANILHIFVSRFRTLFLDEIDTYSLARPEYLDYPRIPLLQALNP